MSVRIGIFEHVFDTLGPAELIDVITAKARESAAADAEKYAAIAAFMAIREAEGAERVHWAADAYDGALAEIGAALNVGFGRADGEVDIAVALRDRFPKVAALFHQGLLNGRRVWRIERRTRLVTDPDALAALDAAIAERIVSWGPIPEYRLDQLLDVEVEKLDPDAVIRARTHVKQLDFVIGDDRTDEHPMAGTTAYWGRMTVADAAVARQRLATLLDHLCPDDPRNSEQRRAAALAAIMAGEDRMACHCENPDCPSVGTDPTAANTVIHVLTDQASIDAATAMNQQPVSEPEPRTPQPVAIIPATGAVIPGPLLADLIARGATIAPLPVPVHGQQGYRPGKALDRFVRLRDLTCRAPGCHRPAEFADIDHTVAYPSGPTHAGNTKPYCRKHHLIKTFHDGWSERQLPDGTLHVTTPTGHTYTTRPGSVLLFPTWSVHTPAPPSTPAAPGAHRSEKMPRRKRTRTQATSDRINAERKLNAAEPPAPF